MVMRRALAGGQIGRWVVGIVLVMAATIGMAQQVGGLRGVVVDADSGEPVAQARVNVVEAMVNRATSEDGLFSFDDLKPGTYTVTISKDGYVRKVQADVVVTGGQFVELRVELAPEVYEMEELVVRGFDLGAGTELGLLEIRQEATALQDAISAELMRRAGAGTAAAALRLVVGTTVREGKYVVIRGLADRYTTTLLNDVRLPTSDADKRAVQLDQFPAAQIENITVLKSFTPDQQGDSTGGTVKIGTRTVPERRFFSISGSTEYNTQTTGNDRFLTYRGGGAPVWALDDGGRDIPFRAREIPAYLGPSLNPVIASNRLPNAQQIDRLTRSLSPVMGVSRKTVGPSYGFGLAGGDRIELGADASAGFTAGFAYKQDYKFYENGQRRVGVTFPSANTEPDPGTLYQDARGTDEVQWGALFGLGYRLDTRHQLGLVFTHNQIATDEARFLESRDDPAEYLQSQSLRYKERTMQSTQLTGQHVFDELGGLKADWVGAYSATRQYEPDQRFFRNVYDPIGGGSAFFGDPFNRNLRVWRDVEEESLQGQFNLTVPFRQWTDTEGNFKFGPFYDLTERTFRQDSVVYIFAPQLGSGPARDQNFSYGAYPGPGLWTDVFLEPHRIGLATNGAPAINQLLWYLQPSNVDIDYSAEQIIGAGYAMLELPLTSWFRLIGGARYELTDLSIQIRSPNGTITVLRRTDTGEYNLELATDEEASTALRQWDLLPQIGAIWEILPKLYLRTSWSRTIARPTFRELAPVRTFEFLGADQFVGNPDLVISQIENYDLRLEWFRRPGDLVAISAFYKKIEDPIELISFIVGGGSRFAQPVNYPEGWVKGIEFEVRQRLDILAPWLADFTIGGNLALISSEVTLPEEEQAGLQAIGINATSRAMLGQPNYLANANIVYDNPRTGTAIGLFYNLSGEKLIVGQALATNYNPDVFELPVESLDLSVEQKIGKHWRITFRAKNLTDPLIREVYRASWTSDITRSAYRRGIDFSLGATCSW
ncbi:MAG: TonB-dependent receptor [Verrucomicrobiae bacterium]|nr:TonB-dependent receptor [Verrucomicrobiae bacterium]